MAKTPYKAKDLYLSPAPNLIINGAMDFWQRATATTALNLTASYTADRFVAEKAGGGALIDWVRSTTVPTNEFTYSLRFTGAESNDELFCFQRIESHIIKSYIGRTMTFSLWLQSTTTDAVDLKVLTPTGAVDVWSTDISGTPDVTEFSSSTAFSTSWVRHSFSFVVPTNATKGLAVGFHINGGVGTGDIYRTTGWMLTEGSTTPANFYRAGASRQSELSMCQRYYEKSYDLDVAPATVTSVGVISFTPQNNVSNGNNLGGAFMFKVQKRSTPVVTFYNPVTGTANSLRFNAANFVVAVGEAGEWATYIENATGGAFSADTASAAGTIHFTADAEL